MILTRKWSSVLFTSTPKCSPINFRNGMISSRTMDRLKCTSVSLTIFSCPHSLMTLIWDYTLNWINENIIQCEKPSIFLVTPWTATDNIKKKNFYYYYLGDYSPGYTLVSEKTARMLNSNFQNGVLALFKILKWCWWCKSRHKGDKMTEALKNHIDCSEIAKVIVRDWSNNVCDISTGQYQSSSGLLRYHEFTEIYMK